MQFGDVVLALLSILLWSANLIVIKIASMNVPLEFFNFMRFACCIPFIFFIKKPQIVFSKILIVAIFWYVLNFFFMGLALHYGLGAGVVSVVYQSCCFFGVFFCYLLMNEIPKPNQIFGMLLAFIGILFLFNDSFANSHNLSVLGLVFILLAALCWGFGIALIKKYKLAADLSTNIWLATYAALPMAGIVFLRGGYQAFTDSIQAISPILIFEILFAVLGPTILAGCFWFRLLKKYPSSIVTPFIFLLPPISFIFSYFFLDERYSLLQFFAFMVILAGILLNQNLLKLNLIKRSSLKLWKKLTLTN